MGPRLVSAALAAAVLFAPSRLAAGAPAPRGADPSGPPTYSRVASARRAPITPRSFEEHVPPAPPTTAQGILASPTYASAVRAGCEFLVRVQERDGSWSGLEGRTQAPIAVTALSALALLASGSSPSRGPHADSLRRALAYLIERCDGRGFFTAEGDATSRMHGHGFATLALAEAYGMTPATGEPTDLPHLERTLVRAVRLCEKSQSSLGGWMYEPERTADHEGSVTICIVQALRAARDAGIAVSKGTIDRAVEYVRKSQKPDGSFRYMLGVDKSSYALTAAALSTLHATGEYDGKAIDRGFEYMGRHEREDSPSAFEPDPWPEYTRLYAAQAYFHAPDVRRFENWFPRPAAYCLAEQREDGSWWNDDYGDAYATAMSLLFLAIPAGYLPAFQR